MWPSLRGARSATKQSPRLAPIAWRRLLRFARNDEEIRRVGKAKRAHRCGGRVRTALRAFAHPTFLLLAFCGVARPADIPLDQRRSGYQELGPDTKAMQDDDTANPATFWVLDGETLWNAKA